MTTVSVMQARLQSLQQQADPEGLKEVLMDIASLSDTTQVTGSLETWFDVVLSAGFSIVSKRPLLAGLVDVLRKSSPDIQVAVGRHAVQRLQTGVASYEDQDTSLREILADALTSQEEYIEAAKALQGIQLESSQRKVSEEDKFNMWIRICRLYLEEDDTTTAETFLNRAKNLLYRIDDKEAQLKFKLSQARISDSQRRFLEAGTVYHDISLAPLLAQEERDLTLSKAIICAVLAPAGTSRTALLRKLHRDERSHHLDEFEMLERMYLGRLVSPEQTQLFSRKLDPHQVAATADGSTVLTKAIIEHNLLGISNLYHCISMMELGMLLGLDALVAEEYAATMVEQARLNAHIDHVDGFIHFGTVAEGPKACRVDERIRLLLEEVERVATLLNVS